MFRRGWQAAVMGASAAVVMAPSAWADGPDRSYRPLSWTGFYVGVNVGYGTGDHDRVTELGFANSYDSEGWLAGLHGGYLYQTGPWVLGIEGDVKVTGIRGNDGGVGGTTDETRADYLASLRARLGLAQGGVLFYGTGGFAWADLTHTNADGVPSTHSSNVTGWVAGGGVEWKLASNLSLGIEYLHYDLGSYSLSPAGLVPFSVESTYDTVSARLSYKFGN